MFRNLVTFFKNKPAFAVGFLFAVSSSLFGIWVASIPAIKERLHFTDGSLGLSLLLAPCGSITGMVLSTRIFSKVSVGRWMYVGYSMLCFMMILQINSYTRWMLWICLYCFGLLGFLNGVSANATVNMMEKKSGKLYMSTCHGMYSMGGALSGGIAATLFAIHIPTPWQIVVVSTVLLAILFFNRHHLLAHHEVIHSRSSFKPPSLVILGISFICMVSFMAEGCVADWSAIYFKEVLLAPKAYISLGYAGFSLAMTLGRFNGDNLVTKLGSKRIVIGGNFLTACGFLLVISTYSVMLSIIGYIIIGLGCCCIVPVLFRASANIPGVSTVEGFAMVTTGGLVGFLTGPSVIGIISEKAGLSKGLSLLILMALLSAFVAWKSPFIIRKKPEPMALPFDGQLY